MQQELNIMGAVGGGMKNVPWNEVACCAMESDAINLCLKHAHVYRSHREWALIIGLVTRGGDPDESAFSRVINAGRNKKPRYLPLHKYRLIQQVAGNRAIEQWAELYEKGELNCQRSVEDQKAELRAKLAALESA